MDLLLILTYAAFAYGAFRLFKIPVNGFTLLTAVLGGVALIGALLLGMNYNHPFTSQARFYFNTTPIVPAVSGVVIEVPVKANTLVKTGDVLFRIDPKPFENAVKAKEAALAAAVQTTHQLRATADAAQKKLESSLADRDSAKDVFERSKRMSSNARKSCSKPAPLPKFNSSGPKTLSMPPKRPRKVPSPKPTARCWKRKPSSRESIPTSPVCRPNSIPRSSTSNNPSCARRPTAWSSRIFCVPACMQLPCRCGR